MTRLTTTQLNKIRNHPQQTQLHLSIFQPRPVFKAQINNPAAARGDRIIAFDNVTLGSYLDIRADSFMLIGTTDGARDVGTVRVRAASSIELTVAENSDIRWQDNLYLTVLYFFNIDARYTRLTHDPNNFESVVFWKDYDVAYTNQNSILGTFVNAGPHRAMFRDCASGLAETNWYSTGTYNLISGTVQSYDWAFEGGTPSGSSLANPGRVTYNAPGHYVTRLTVSGTFGAVDTTYRYVSVYDRPGCGTGTPPLKWELGSLNGSRGEGGYRAHITLREIIDIHEGDVVVIFSENWYGDEKISFGPNPPEIVFTGYILDDSISINYNESKVEFDAGSASAIMKQAEGFSCSVESKSAPSTWLELLDMDIRRAVYHYLRWHTTVLNTTDVQFLGTDQKIQFFDADRGSLYDAIDSLIRSALVGEVVADKTSKLWLEVSAYAQPNATGTFIPIMTTEKRDWIHSPNIDESLAAKTSFIEMGGIAYSGSTTGTFSALLSNAPGTAPSYRGSVERTQGLALYDQAQLDRLAGNVLAYRNARFPIIDMEMAGNYSNLDIAPQEAVQIDILPEDNMRGQRINGPYVPSSIRWTWNPNTGLLHPNVSFDVITAGDAGSAIPIPDVPPTEGFSNISRGGFASPTFPTFPSLFAIPSYLILQPATTAAINPNLSTILWQSGIAFGTTQLNVGRINFNVSGLFHFDLVLQGSIGTAAPGFAHVAASIRNANGDLVKRVKSQWEHNDLATLSTSFLESQITFTMSFDFVGYAGGWIVVTTDEIDIVANLADDIVSIRLVTPL